MNVKDKMKDLTLKNMIILVTYTVVLIVCLMNFDIVLYYLGQVLSVVKPFLIGLGLAFIFNIPMKLFYKKLKIKDENKKRFVSAILSILVVLLVLVIVVMVVLPQVIANVKMLINNMPEIFSQIEEWLSIILKDVNMSPEIMEKIENFQQTLGKTILSKLSTWVPSIAIGVTHFTTSLMNLFMGCIMAFYMVFSKDKLIAQVKKVGEAFLSKKQFQYSRNVLELIASTFENFFAGQLTESIIIGVLCYIGCVVLDIPYASIAAIVIGFTNIIPYFGPFIGAFISSVLIIFVSPMKVLIFIIFSSILQQVESNLIYPHVVGSSIGLSALWVLFAVSVGGGLFGIMGMVFGLPTFSVLYELVRRWTNEKLLEKKRIESQVRREESN